MTGNNAVQRVYQRVLLLVSRAVVSAVSDGSKMQSLQLNALHGEVRDDVERFQNYGFTSVPHTGAEAVVVFPSGNREHGLVVVVDDRRYRLRSLSAGEVALYSDEGDAVVLKRGRVVEITTNTLRVNALSKIELNAPTVEMNASTRVQANTPVFSSSGDVQDQDGKTMSGMRTVFNGHSHSGDSGGTTGGPGGSM
ncbi:phage baseplate assembly protein V [Jiella pelagia]|uniref:Phage baseplate assembly protein V n=1 Tax=Jiella pelagia TaxID=2986949 RepID=A0ABY7C5C3_9HYPH|nr:phage baseplate assembly protein V [Jiella pelagia]WAP69035.1 phage baseplate assembly protein V [Jiella pelagia]